MSVCDCVRVFMCVCVGGDECGYRCGCGCVGV